MSQPEPRRRASGPETGPETIRVTAVHLDGVRTIEAGERKLELRFSDDGLEILSTETGAVVGHLGWDEIRSLEVPRARRGLYRRGSPQLVVGTERGRATFELTDLTDEQVQEHLAPILARARDARRSD